jgi:integrase/recombinase XerD
VSEAKMQIEPVAPTSGASEGLYLGDAIHFFLNAKRAGGRSARTIDDYRKKLELFQRWLATRVGSEDAVDAPYIDIGADAVEAYVVYLRDERAMADSSRKNHLAVLRSFFQTISRRLELPDPTRMLDEVRFHQGSPKRTYVTKREAEILLSSMDKQVTIASKNEREASSAREARRRTLAGVLAARDHGAFSAMIYAGLRIEETASLTVEELGFSRGEEEVRVARGKGNKERVVPMSPKLKRSLRRYLKLREELLPVGDAPPPHLFLNEKGERVTENTLRRRLYKWLRKSGIKKQDLKPHDLRRTFGT